MRPSARHGLRASLPPRREWTVLPATGALLPRRGPAGGGVGRMAFSGMASLLGGEAVTFPSRGGRAGRSGGVAGPRPGRGPGACRGDAIVDDGGRRGGGAATCCQRTQRTEGERRGRESGVARARGKPSSSSSRRGISTLCRLPGALHQHPHATLPPTVCACALSTPAACSTTPGKSRHGSSSSRCSRACSSFMHCILLLCVCANRVWQTAHALPCSLMRSACMCTVAAHPLALSPFFLCARSVRAGGWPPPPSAPPPAVGADWGRPRRAGVWRGAKCGR